MSTSAYLGIGGASLLVVVAIHYLVQKRHTVLRNFRSVVRADECTPKAELYDPVVVRWWIALAMLVACGPDNNNVDVKPSDVEKEVEAELARYEKLVADFRDDLAAGRLDAAYARLAPMTQATVKPDGLVALAKHPALAAGVNYSFRRASTTNGLMIATGQLDGVNGAARLEVHFTAVQGKWHIATIAIDGGAILPPR